MPSHSAAPHGRLAGGRGSRARRSRVKIRLIRSACSTASRLARSTSALGNGRPSRPNPRVRRWRRSGRGTRATSSAIPPGSAPRRRCRRRAGKSGSRTSTAWPSERSRSPVSSTARRSWGSTRAGSRRLGGQRHPQPARRLLGGRRRSGAGRRCRRPRRGAARRRPRCAPRSRARSGRTSARSSGESGIRSRCGFRPTSPQLAAGMRIEPAPSDAVAAAASPAATAARAAAARAAGRGVDVPGVARHAERGALGVADDRQLGEVRLAEHHGAGRRAGATRARRRAAPAR